MNSICKKKYIISYLRQTTTKYIFIESSKYLIFIYFESVNYNLYNKYFHFKYMYDSDLCLIKINTQIIFDNFFKNKKKQKFDPRQIVLQNPSFYVNLLHAIFNYFFVDNLKFLLITLQP